MMKKNASLTRTQHRTSRLTSLVLAATLAGCAGPKSADKDPAAGAPHAPEVVQAEQLFDGGRTQEAISACIDIARKRPDAPGLADLQQRITRRLADERAAAAEKRADASDALRAADAKRFGVSPDTYGQRQHVVGDNTSLRTAMQKVLQNPVSVHLVNADINAIIEQLGQSQNINIIADSEISEKSLTVHAENTPLVEILEYIGRNLNVTFSVGNNLIWVTPKEEVTTGAPLETRVYRLRKGMLGTELGKSAQGVSLFKGPEERSGRSSSQQQQEKKDEKKEAKVGLLESIERFVPQPEGADFLFNDKAHALIVKNTRENLALVEDLITAMDIRPVQILIEARFVTSTVSDLRELGVEWLIDNRGPSKFTSGSTSTTTDPWLRGHETVTEVRNDVVVGTIKGVAEDGTGGANFGYQFLLGDTALQAVLNALQKNGQSRTVVVPRVTTLNNREARFRVGEDTSYFEEVDTSIMTSGGYGNSESRDNVTYDYDRPTIVETGYSLIVTPSVGADLSTINVVLRPEISSIKEWKKYRLSSLDNATDAENEPAIEIPVLSRQYIETEAVVRSGETIVLGGLVDASKSKESSGTPWLSTLPFIGNLFRVDKDKEEAKNILIFVTATLISDAGEDLIPLNQVERYGVAVPAGAAVPEILKNPPAAETTPAAEAKPAAEVKPADAAPAIEATPAPAAEKPAPPPAPAAPAPAENPAPVAPPEKPAQPPALAPVAPAPAPAP
jgi:type II secretory pathway component GspD/PulD (secretin)